MTSTAVVTHLGMIAAEEVASTDFSDTARLARRVVATDEVAASRVRAAFVLTRFGRRLVVWIAAEEAASDGKRRRRLQAVIRSYRTQQLKKQLRCERIRRLRRRGVSAYGL